MTAEYATDTAVSEPPKEPKNDEDLLVLARERHERSWQYEDNNHEQMVDDMEFAGADRIGGQWDERVRQEREQDNRPVLTFNHIPKYIRQVTGDIRLNKPAIKVRPVDSGSDPEVAKIYTGLIRNIEQRSFATTAYITAAENTAKCGQGHWRITTEYASDDVFDQDLWVRRIRNPLSVFFDPDAQEVTREDARWCFVLEEYSEEEFKATWPKARMENFEGEHNREWSTRWYKNKTITVAEYWFKRDVKKQLTKYPDGRVVDSTGWTAEEKAAAEEEAGQWAEAQLQAGNSRALGMGLMTREVDGHDVMRAVINGAEVLEQPRKWPGKYIPIIPMIGEETYINDRVIRHGIVRHMKDAQRVYNYDRSAMVELISLQPKAPYIVTPAQIAGFEDLYERANTDNMPYLLYNPDDKNPGPPKRERTPEFPVALAQSAQIALEDMNGVTGIYPAALGQQSNETSGKAIIARERQGDVGTFVYMDNLSQSIGYTGRQLVDLIPKIYDGERIIRVLGEDDTEELMQVNALDPETGAIINDLGTGKYDVIVNSGPSFSTKRQESADTMIELMKSNPEIANQISDLFIKNLDLPEGDEMVKRIRKTMIAQGLIEPDPEQGEEMPPEPGPDPDMIEAEAKVMETEAKAEKTLAEAEGQQIQNEQAMVNMQMERLMRSGALELAVQQILIHRGIVPNG
ncbi:portal protein [Denitrobaculum tricleocarpae]|uniref:Portal protein n=1 Tax=Denitrobaculum tricleocarpae TaxID=2591009 RepID=A0A545TSX3_9PROT|nr:portal protein [Denitrobaculum tricleocarpae]TQV80325.1 hypothetical protein FKG95_09015 [Denitrobaculum tricleocarpae]